MERRKIELEGVKFVRFFLISILLFSFVGFAQLIDVSFFQTDIRDALSLLSYDAGKPIIYDKTVTGFVTLEVQQVTIEKALDLILMPYGYQWVQVDGVYFVGTPDPKSLSFFELSRTYIYTTKGIDAPRLVSMLPPVMKDYVFANPSEPNMVVINAPPKIAGKIAETLSMMDIPKDELIVEVKVIETGQDTLKKWGISWQYSDQKSSNEAFTMTFLDMAFDLIYQKLDFTVLGNIQLSIEDGSAKLLANPKLKLLSTTTGKVTAKTQRSYITVVDDKETTKTMDLGIEVEIKPVVLKSGETLMDVKITTTNILDRNTRIPDTTTHSLNSTLKMKLGETITAAAIGFDTYTTTVDKIPVLGDIPVVGYLFKKESISKVYREVLILIKCTKAGEEP